jgi:hypothetical protein
MRYGVAVLPKLLELHAMRAVRARHTEMVAGRGAGQRETSKAGVRKDADERDDAGNGSKTFGRSKRSISHLCNIAQQRRIQAKQGLATTCLYILVAHATYVPLMRERIYLYLYFSTSASALI